MSIFFIRHGEPDYSFMTEHSHCSLSNLAPLTENGKKQAIALRETINEIKNSIIISSPYTRTLQTAFLATGRNDIIIDYDIHEWIPDKNFTINAGEIANINKDFNLGIQVIGKPIYESMPEMAKRMQQALNKYNNENIIVFSHARIIASYLESIGKEEKYLKYCEIYKL